MAEESVIQSALRRAGQFVQKAFQRNDKGNTRGATGEGQPQGASRETEQESQRPKWSIEPTREGSGVSPVQMSAQDYIPYEVTPRSPIPARSTAGTETRIKSGLEPSPPDLQGSVLGEQSADNIASIFGKQTLANVSHTSNRIAFSDALESSPSRRDPSSTMTIADLLGEDIDTEELDPVTRDVLRNLEREKLAKASEKIAGRDPLSAANLYPGLSQPLQAGSFGGAYFRNIPIFASADAIMPWAVIDEREKMLAANVFPKENIDLTFDVATVDPRYQENYTENVLDMYNTLIQRGVKKYGGSTQVAALIKTAGTDMNMQFQKFRSFANEYANAIKFMTESYDDIKKREAEGKTWLPPKFHKKLNEVLVGDYDVDNFMTGNWAKDFNNVKGSMDMYDWIWQKFGSRAQRKIRAWYQGEKIDGNPVYVGYTKKEITDDQVNMITSQLEGMGASAPVFWRTGSFTKKDVEDYINGLFPDQVTKTMQQPYGSGASRQRTEDVNAALQNANYDLSNMRRQAITNPFGVNTITDKGNRISMGAYSMATQLKGGGSNKYHFSVMSDPTEYVAAIAAVKGEAYGLGSSFSRADLVAQVRSNPYQTYSMMTEFASSGYTQRQDVYGIASVKQGGAMSDSPYNTMLRKAVSPGMEDNWLAYTTSMDKLRTGEVLDVANARANFDKTFQDPSQMVIADPTKHLNGNALFQNRVRSTLKSGGGINVGGILIEGVNDVGQYGGTTFDMVVNDTKMKGSIISKETIGSETITKLFSLGAGVMEGAEVGTDWLAVPGYAMRYATPEDIKASAEDGEGTISAGDMVLYNIVDGKVLEEAGRDVPLKVGTVSSTMHQNFVQEFKPNVSNLLDNPIVFNDFPLISGKTYDRQLVDRTFKNILTDYTKETSLQINSAHRKPDRDLLLYMVSRMYETAAADQGWQQARDAGEAVYSRYINEFQSIKANIAKAGGKSSEEGIRMASTVVTSVHNNLKKKFGDKVTAEDAGTGPMFNGVTDYDLMREIYLLMPNSAKAEGNFKIFMEYMKEQEANQAKNKKQ